MVRLPAAVLVALCSVASSHMMLNYPPAFNSSNNPHTTGPADPFLYYPTTCCGREYATTGPCHGYLSLLGTPAGAPVASWAAGSKQQYSLTGAGNHYGGSCQVGFSTDGGKTFKVATSYEGNCPHRNGGVTPSSQTFDFTVPHDLPTGDVVFAWTFVNREREFFMNCAAVTITSPGGDHGVSKAASSKSAAGVTVQNIKNAAPSYDMGGCACTCPSAFEGDRDNTYTSGPCHCSCDAMPPMSKTGGLYARRGLIEARQAMPMYSMGDCACTCAKQAKKYHSGKYETAGCLCTCKTQPSLVSAGSSQRRAVSVGQDGAMHATGAWKHSARLARNPGHEHNERTTVSWDERPEMLFANVVADCKSPLTDAELEYPNPGPEVVPGDGAYPLQLPSGDCA